MFGTLTAGSNTTLSSASATLLPNTIGDFILPKCGQSGHTSGLCSSNVLHKYGPFMLFSFSVVSSGVYSVWFLDSFCAALSPSEQNLAIDNPARHNGSVQLS